MTTIKPQMDHSMDMIYIETKDEIKDPFIRGAKSLRQIFEEDRKAQGLWILQPDAREPYRISWKQVLGNVKPQRRKSK